MPDSSLTPEESFLIQGHALAECLIHLGDLENKKDPLIVDNVDRVFGQTAKMLFGQGHPVFRNQGTLITVLYMFLVLPYEWNKAANTDKAANEKGFRDFDKIDLSEAEKVANDRAKVSVEGDTYPRKDQALRHFRNALSHGRIGLSANGDLVVEDRDDRNGHKYVAEYSMEDVSEFAQSLNMAIAKYIETVIKPRKKNA